MTPDNSLPEYVKTILLNTARRVIESKISGVRFEDDTGAKPPILDEKRGVFVTLRKNEKLRGCIGFVNATKPLYQAVKEAANSSAFEDPRFSPVEKEEVSGLDIEISVLTPSEPVASWQDIELGRHGIIMSKHGSRALFLPQVATEQGWDIETTLRHLAGKAGLGPDDWREGASFEVFEAIVFGE